MWGGDPCTTDALIERWNGRSVVDPDRFSRVSAGLAPPGVLSVIRELLRNRDANDPYRVDAGCCALGRPRLVNAANADSRHPIPCRESPDR